MVALGIFGIGLGELWFFVVVSVPRALPFDTIYAFPFIHCLGGGAYVVTAVVLAILADAVPSETR